MYTVTVCIVSVTAVVALTSLIFAAAVAAVAISHGVKYTSAAVRAFWCNRIAISISQALRCSALAPRRVR